MVRHVIAIDVGGHTIRTALCDASGSILEKRQAPTHRHATSAEENVSAIAREITAVLQAHQLSARQVDCIAIGVPGLTDTERGLVVTAPNIPGWQDLPLKERLQQQFPTRLVLENDVNLAAVGEYWKGSAQHCSHFFFMALGTGIGGGVFINGALYRGARYGAGEVGYLVLHPHQRERRLGDLGWIESIASGVAIEERGRQAAARRPDSLLARLARPKVSAGIVFEAAERGDPEALKVCQEVTDYLALAVVNITALLDPELIVFGGGVSSQGERLLAPVRSKAEGFGLVIPPIRQSKLQDEAQLYGAIFTALHARGKARK